MKTDKLFAEISNFIAESRSLLARGAMQELAGLDKQVKRLCEQALMLPQADKLRYAEKLQPLLDDLTALGDEMAARRDRVGEKIRDASEHRKASVAYRKVEASDGE